MAKLDSILTFTGRLGNIIAYSRGGQHYLRSRPETVRQTVATRRAALWFGAASRKGALIRSAIVPDLDIHCDGTLVNRLNQAIILAGRNNHVGITGFRFNPYTGIEQFFPQRPTISPNGQLHIPAQQLHTPEGATHLEVKLIASRIDFASRRVTTSNTTVHRIHLALPFEGADMSVDAPGKGTLVLTLQVRMYRNNEAICNRKHYAADILFAGKEGTRKASGRPTSFRKNPQPPVHTHTTIHPPIIQRE